ncbi:hypothetical protein [Rubritalea sp.]|uniref:hypothetical protein n=1 Tax=Rubritalea sp. TaxID=2109375 RepID=UPI003EF27BA0
MKNNIQSIFIYTVALLFAIIVITVVLSSGGNEVGALALILSFVFLLVGLLVPKSAVYLLVFLAAYSDLLKRFLILGSSLSELDLVYVLAMSPMVLAGITSHCLISGVLHSSNSKYDNIRFCFCTFILCLVALNAAMGDGGMKSLRGVADYGVFIYLIYVLPIIFRENESLVRYAKFAAYVFIPVAIYGVWQRVYGLAGFELDYLATGLSIESRQLADVDIRPFSTLNSASSLTIVMSACAMIMCICLRYKAINTLVGVLLIGLFSLSCVMTFTRAGWITLMIYPLIVLLIRYKWTTIIMYVFGIFLLISLVVFSDWFLNNLHGWQSMISGDYGESTQAYRVTTLYDRFLGFSNVKNPDNWQPFGVDHEPYASEYRYDDPAFSHDMISRFLFKWGYIPTFILLISAVVFLRSLHRSMFRLSVTDRKYVTTVVGAVLSLLVSIIAGTYIFQFPANIFLFILISLSIHSISPNEERLRT